MVCCTFRTRFGVVQSHTTARSPHTTARSPHTTARSRTTSEHPTKTHRSNSEPRAWLPPPRCPRPCTTLPAPRLCLRHASMSRLLRTCVVDSLTHTQRSILPASPPSSLSAVPPPATHPCRPTHRAPRLRSMWLHLLVCTTEMCHLEMCHLGAQVHTLIDRCANNEAVHDPRCSAPPGNR